MTLRVEVSIVPFGDEDDKRIIKTLNISNLGMIDFDECEYGVEVDKYKTKQYDTRLYHIRSEGAEKLVKLALEKLGY